MQRNYAGFNSKQDWECGRRNDIFFSTLLNCAKLEEVMYSLSMYGTDSIHHWSGRRRLEVEWAFSLSAASKRIDPQPVGIGMLMC